MNADDETISACIVAKPASEDSYAAPVHKFATILQPGVDDLYLITGDNVANYSQLSGVKCISIGSGSYTGTPYVDFFIVQFHIIVRLMKVCSEVDVVYFHKGTMPLSLPVIVLWPLGICTCVVKLSDYYSNRNLSRYSRLRIHFVTALQWLSFRFADAAVAFTSHEAQDIPNDTVYISFSNYINFERFDIDTPFHRRKFNLGFVGRFTEVKGVETFTKAAKDIVEDNPNVRITLVGDGPLNDSVERIVNNHDQIELPGWIDNDELPSKYNQIQVLVAPSKSEGLPTVILEAMGCGVVVVSTRVGSVEEIIIDGKTGFLLDGRTKRELKRSFEKIWSRNDLEDISESARDSVVDRYSKSAAQERFERITRDLAAGAIGC